MALYSKGYNDCMTTIRRILRLVLGLPLIAGAPAVAQSPDVIVAAAASLRPALDDVVAAFRKTEEPARVEIVYGASGTLARQAIAGAPFQLFLAADEATAKQVHAAGRARDEGRIYVIGRIAIATSAASTLALDSNLAGLATALAEGRVRRIAIATPALAPYGRAAQQALEKRGLWAAAEPRLAFGENVAQAAQFVVSGAADVGFVALSTIKAPALSGRTRHAVIDQALHDPIRHRMVLIANAGAMAERLYGFVAAPAAAAIWQQHGFDATGAE